MSKLKVIFMGKGKRVVQEAAMLTVMGGAMGEIGFDNIEVAAYVSNGDEAKEWFNDEDVIGQNIPILNNETLYDFDLGSVDLVVSFLYPRKIKKPAIIKPRLGCINFHPAPLPKYRGVACYSRAILENDHTYGVSCHFVDEKFDTGDLIKVNTFDIDVGQFTAFSLEQVSSRFLYDLYKEVMGSIGAGEEIPRVKQDSSESIYTSIRDLDILRMVNENDSEEEIDRKIRAFWFPGFPGAAIKVGDSEYTLINEQLIKEIKGKYFA